MLPGKFSNPVPLMIGTNENEGVLFNPLPMNVTATDMDAAASAWFGPAAAAATAPLYPVRGSAR